MAGSHHTNLTPIVQQIMELKPKSVLDLGIGSGKYGCYAENT